MALLDLSRWPLWVRNNRPKMVCSVLPPGEVSALEASACWLAPLGAAANRSAACAGRQVQHDGHVCMRVGSW